MLVKLLNLAESGGIWDAVIKVATPWTSLPLRWLSCGNQMKVAAHYRRLRRPDAT
jgi:hypothetical protein